MDRGGVEAVLFYLAAYAFMNVGAFAVVGQLSPAPVFGALVQMGGVAFGPETVAAAQALVWF